MMGNPTVTDEQLIAHVVAGNTDTFGELVERYLPMVQAVVFARLGNTIDIDDIVQEAFIKAYQSLGKLRERNKFAPWLASITRNTALRMARKAGKDPRETPETLDGEAASQVVPPPDHARMEILGEIRRQVAHLGDTSRETIMLYYFSGHSTPEIAAMLETSDAVVRKRPQRAREDLGTRLLPRFQTDELRPQAQKGRVASILSATLASGAASYGASAQATSPQLVATPSLLKSASIPLWGKVAATVVVLVGVGAALVNFAPNNASNDGPATPTEVAPTALASSVVNMPRPTPPPQNREHAAALLPNETDIDAFSGDFSIDGGVMRPVGAKDVSDSTVELFGFDSDLPVSERRPVLLRRFSPPSDGAFRISDLASGHYVIRATDPDGLWGISSTFMSGTKLAGSVLAILMPIAPFGGTVLDVAGNPVAGARIRPTDYAGKLGATDLSIQMGLVLAATTNENGHFQFDYIYEGTYNVEIFATGCGSTFIQGIQTGELNRSFPLEATGSISGRVFNESTGEAVSDTQVSLNVLSAFSEYAATTDEGGNFDLTNIPLGEYSIRVEHEELLPSTPDLTIQVASADSDSPISIPLLPGGIVSGQLVDADSTAGIGGAQVQLAPADRNSGGPLRRSTTEADGTYTIKGLPQGKYSVQVYHAPGYPSYGDRNHSTQPVEVTTGAVVGDINFALRQEGLSISGRLLDDRGKAHGGVHIRVKGIPEYASLFALSDQHGRFSLGGLAPNRDYPLEARMSNYQTRPDVHVTLEEESVKDIELVLVQGALLAGQVVDVQGNALANAFVLAMPTDGDGGGTALRSNQTDNDGFYRLRGVPPGTYNLHINNLYGAPADTITIIEGVERPYGSFLVARDTNALPILGRVVDEKGKPIAMADIYLKNVGGYPVAKSNESGEFRLTGTSKAVQSIQVRHPDYSPSSGEGEGGGPRITITLPGLGALSGQVVDATTNQPISDFSLSPIPGEQGFVPPTSFREASGAFLLEKLPAGEMSLLASAPGYAPRVVPTPKVVAQTTQKGVTIALQLGTILSGAIRNSSGAPVADAQLYVDSAAHSMARNSQFNPIRSDADGTFRMVDVSLESSVLFVRHPDYATTSVPLQLGLADNDLDIIVEDGSSLEGTIRVDGALVSSGVLTLTLQDGKGSLVLNRTIRTDDNGYYHVQGLPSGQAELHYHGNDGSDITFATTIENRPTQNVDLDFEAGSAGIAGTIAPLPVGTFPIRVDLQLETSSGTARYSAAPTREGSFQFSNLPSGQATIIATLFDGNDERYTELTFDVESEQQYDVSLVP